MGGENPLALPVSIPKIEKRGPSSKSPTLESSRKGSATFTAEEAPSIVDEKWHDDKGWMFWSSLGQEVLTKTLTEDAKLGIENVVLEGDEEEKFLWVIAKKPNE